MAGLNFDQERELTFLSGINSDGTLAATSFWTWNRDTPATFNMTSSDELKWGSPAAGTGATVTFAFDPASNWGTAEQNAFTTSLHLWSAIANISFTPASDAATADLSFVRGSDGMAETRLRPLQRGVIDTAQLGTTKHATVQIDTSVPGFGPIGSSFAVEGGYPWAIALHEIGHAIGVGHGGTYNEGDTTGEQPYTLYDSTAWSVMSYIEPNDFRFSGRVIPATNYGNAPDGSLYVPQTLGPLDILAAQRIYGAPTNTPLSGGQIFGYNSNITGDLGQYYDFTRNTHPIVTLWDLGGGNRLDLSGFGSISNTVDLHQGAFSSVGGMSNNLAVAFGTHIESFVGDAATEYITGNDDGDLLMGGGGGDYITAGRGNDHVYGNLQTSQQGAVDGADSINAGDGSNYVNGNAGNDTIEAGWGTNRLYGGAGNDTIIVRGGGNSHINGNTGDDFLQVNGGFNDIHGGQGNDTFAPQGGTNFDFGDAGNDVISGGPGIDVMTGGNGADVFGFGAYGVTSSSLSYDEVTDFTDGLDKLQIPTSQTGQLPIILHGDGRSFSDLTSAQAYAVNLVEPTISAASKSVAALQVGADTYLFFSFRGWAGDHVDSYAKIDHIQASVINQDDFVSSLSPL